MVWYSRMSTFLHVQADMFSIPCLRRAITWRPSLGFHGSASSIVTSITSRNRGASGNWAMPSAYAADPAEHTRCGYNEGLAPFIRSKDDFSYADAPGHGDQVQ